MISTTRTKWSPLCLVSAMCGCPPWASVRLIILMSPEGILTTPRDQSSRWSEAAAMRESSLVRVLVEKG